jgi:hypothetical protein
MPDAVPEAADSPAPPYPSASPPPMAPAELHRYLVRIHRQRNRLDWRFFQGLLALDEGQIYAPLGYPSSQSYAQQSKVLPALAGAYAVAPALESWREAGRKPCRRHKQRSPGWRAPRPSRIGSPSPTISRSASSKSR